MVSNSSKIFQVGLLGARGFVGRELMQLFNNHPGFTVSWASSREHNGQPLAQDVPGLDGNYCLMTVEQLPILPVDVYVLALPNGLAQPWVEVIESVNPDAVILDLSADFRFDYDWQYGLPELYRQQLIASRRISNPGCYATAMQLALRPLLELPLAEIHCFGVSGFSGAGSQPVANNNQKLLLDNLKAYKLTGHIHEREVSRQLNRRIRFIPCVAQFFRGIQMTVSMDFTEPVTVRQIDHLYRNSYQHETMVEYSSEIPEVSQVRNTPYSRIGGIQVSDDGLHAVVISVLDNLLKGAASQALQNLNLACGFSETTGLDNDR